MSSRCSCGDGGPGRGRPGRPSIPGGERRYPVVTGSSRVSMEDTRQHHSIDDHSADDKHHHPHPHHDDDVLEGRDSSDRSSHDSL